MSLWDKGYQLNPVIKQFTAGIDSKLDHTLVPFDCRASAVHARMLAHIGVLTTDEAQQLVNALQEIVQAWQNGNFKIAPEHEDCHSAIEHFLVNKLGLVGYKIHTGRSRNDQVLVALRLYEKDALVRITNGIKQMQQTLDAVIEHCGYIQLPGYTHMQPAMPTTIAQWLGAYVCAMHDNLLLLDAMKHLIDQCPLGSAAGFGMPYVPLDTLWSAQQLGFAQTFKNPTHIQNSRGKFEASLVHMCACIMLDLNKCASDLILFNTREFGFVHFDQTVCTGSSIMPQKHNCDALELVRGSYHLVHAHEQAIASVAGNLMSGYHRDFQLIKQPLFQTFEITVNCLQAMTQMLKNVTVDAQRCSLALTGQLYATQRVYELVNKGVPFRQAHQQISRQYTQSKKDTHE